MQKEILYCGCRTIIACDEKCNKAWGVNNRPRINLSEDDDDICYLADDELGEAPADPGTYEGGHSKPPCAEYMNKWCARECERSHLFNIGKEIRLADFSKRVYNQPWKHKGCKE